MRYEELSSQQKEKLYEDLTLCANNLGSVNSLLHLVESLHSQKESPLSSKDKKYSFSKGFVKWDKFIYKDTLELLFNTILNSDKSGSLMDGLKVKEQKRVTNMLKTLKPVTITVKPKNKKDGEGFKVSIVEVDEKDSSDVSLLFKALFFYRIDFAKKALSYIKPD